METTPRRVKRGVTMRRKILGRCLGTVALAAAALLIARLDVQAAPPEDNKEVSQLLEDIKGQAADLQRDSDELESFTRSHMSWQSHAEELDRIKERINVVGKTISKLASDVAPQSKDRTAETEGCPAALYHRPS